MAFQQASRTNPIRSRRDGSQPPGEAQRLDQVARRGTAPKPSCAGSPFGTLRAGKLHSKSARGSGCGERSFSRGGSGRCASSGSRAGSLRSAWGSGRSGRGRSVSRGGRTRPRDRLPGPRLRVGLSAGDRPRSRWESRVESTSRLCSSSRRKRRISCRNSWTVSCSWRTCWPPACSVRARLLENRSAAGRSPARGFTGGSRSPLSARRARSRSRVAARGGGSASPRSSRMRS